ncbi:MAG: SpoIIE family protein phosphatase [Treponema sp.]|nr:SpoIIE family protein phosphatase [Candidatus Treponema caballi]
MFKAQRRILLCITNLVAGLGFVVLTVFLVPENLQLYDKYGYVIMTINRAPEETPLFAGIVGAVVFGLLLLVNVVANRVGVQRIEKKTLRSHETGIISEFIDKLRFAYTVDDFIQVVQTVLEDKADCSILYVDRESNYIIYNSSERIVTDEKTTTKLEQNYPTTWADGYYFLDEELGVVSRLRDARGFFLVAGTKHLYVFCRYTHEFDREIYKQLIEEYKRFESRSKTVAELTEISSLSQEWDALAATQRSFLPQQIPNIKGLDIDAYFRPLVNVSGDYYTILPMDEDKTLVMLGDVSGKGLAAALVMGLVMNTVKIIENKEDLPGVVRAVDQAIKGMHLQDKYTVLFIGIIDTKKMTIKYINASMSDPIIVTRAPDGYKIKPLSSNCSVVGIIELDDIQPAEQKLFRDDLILMASDGVSEVMNNDGVELGDTELYMNTIKNSAYKSAHHIVGDIVDLVLTYNGDKRLRDDVTMMAVKVEG